jgi:hypothetical protein
MSNFILFFLKVKIQSSMSQTNFFFGTLLFKPLYNFSHVAANVGMQELLKKYKKNEFATHFEQIFLAQAHMELELDVLGESL